MATRKTNNSDEERLDSSSMEKVIRLLEPADDTKPISKKAACEILNISYNTTRLGKLIEVYKEKKIREAAQRAAKRGKPATLDEIQYIVDGYLEGRPVDTLASAIYRSPVFVKNILEEYHVPIRARSHDYFRPELIPEGAMKDRFTVGVKAYSAQYDSVVKVLAELPHKVYGYAYKVWLISDKWQQYAFVPACELASLEHLEVIGIKL